MAAGNPDFDALLATTLDNYRPKLEDNVFGNRPLVAWLKRKDRLRVIDGGAHIVEQLMYGENTTAAPYGQWDNLDVTPQQGITAARYDWKQFAAAIAISGLEKLQNNGDEKIIDLLEAKVTQTEESISAAFNRMFYLDGTEYPDGTPNSNAWLGLEALVGDNSGSHGPNTVGGIDCTDSGNDWWRSNVTTGSGWGSSSGFLAGMASAYNTPSVGSDAPDVIFTTQSKFEKYEQYLSPQLRFTDTKTLDGGFQNLLFKTAPMMFDTDCPAGVMWFLNSKYIRLIGHKNEWFTNTPFVRPSNQNAHYAQILCTGQFTTSNRRRHTKIFSIA